MNVYAVFRCEEDGKLFKVNGDTNEGPYLHQYDGEKYNQLQEIPLEPSAAETSGDYRTTVVEEALKIAQTYSEGDLFTIEQFDDKIYMPRLAHLVRS